MFRVVEKADHTACAAHHEQSRKYSGTPYILHPRRVKDVIAPYHPEPGVLAAALLHDVIEDTPISKRTVHGLFGHEIFNLVMEVTNVSTKCDGERAQRKALDFEHFSNASPIGQSIKVADRIDNITISNIRESVVRQNPDFAQTYLRETRVLLGLLTKANKELLNIAWMEFDRAVQELELITGMRLKLAKPGSRE